MAKSDRVVVACPYCQKRYRVRKETLGRRSRCSNCKDIFKLELPDDKGVDRQVLDWLADEAQEQTTAQPASDSGSAYQDDVPEGTAAGLKIINDTNGKAALADSGSYLAPGVKAAKDLTLHRIDAMGAYFRFPAEALLSTRFRAGFPRMCANCLTTKELRIHLIQWTSKVADRGIMAGKGETSAAVMSLAELPTTGTTEILNFLPRNESAPPPFDTPFPYYVCMQCSPIGLMHSNISFHKEGEVCWLNVANLSIAGQFYAAVHGKDNEQYRRLLEHAKKARKDRWQRLPLPVRNRITNWFKAKEGERFVQYWADEDFTKAEVGQAGLVLTNKRLIYKKYHVFREFPLSEPAIITIKGISEGQQIRISGAAKQQAIVKLSSNSWDSFRQELKQVSATIQITEARSEK